MAIERENVRTRLLTIFKEEVGHMPSFDHLEIDALRDEATFLEIGAESLDVVEAILGLENAYGLGDHGIEIADEADTVGDLINATLTALERA